MATAGPLYTRRGDSGETGLLYGGRVSKDDDRVQACGACDEAVSALGLARSLCEDEEVREAIATVQHDLFKVGAELATDINSRHLLEEHFVPVTPDMVDQLETQIDDLQARMELPRAFIVPGASPGSSALDLARAFVRRTERLVVGLERSEMLGNPEVLRYLNRMADYLFMLGRYEDRALPVEIVTGVRNKGRGWLMGRRIAVVNTRASNLHSVEKALVKVGASPQVVSDPGSLLDADAAVLPGVGAFDAAMRALADQDLVDAVRKFAASGRPLLCVCLGMQILLDRSEEGVREGLGIFPGDVKRLPDGMKGQQGESLKIPHMGWNAITFSDSEAGRHPYFKGIEDGTHFYFVHSYNCAPEDPSVVAATADYGVDVCAVVAEGQIVGVQFHPEKSGDSGLRIYANFVAHSA